MNYLNLIDIREHLGTLKRSSSIDNKSGYFEKVFFNHFNIELHASNVSLCEPRDNYDCLLHYQKIQLALYEDIREQEHAISPCIDTRFSGFDWTKYFVYYNSKGIKKPSYMGEYVPVAEVCQLIRDVYKVSRLKIFY